jgi:hypothetical protein
MLLKLLSDYKKARQEHSIKIANRFFKNVSKFKCLGTILSDQNFMPQEFNNRINLVNPCYYRIRFFCFPASCLGM